MSDCPKTARVVIIGGGIVGVSCLYHLAKAGWTDCVLLEKNELTAGSTWHAAGNCPNFSNSWAVLNMQRYSLEMYRDLADDTDYPINYHVTGSIRLAHSKQRMQEFEHVASMGRYQGLELAIETPDELKQRHPFMETHDILGGLWDPLDGDIDPAQLTQAIARRARQLGAKIIRFNPVTGISRNEISNEWIIHSENGDISCEYVVNAAGYYAQRVGEWFKPFGGRTVPMVVMSHQYLLTGEIPELEEWTRENGRKVPLLRDVDISYYLRQDKHGLNLGPYERNCRAHWLTPDDPMPDDFSFQLYPDDLERLEFYIEDAMERVPILGSQGVERVINGPIPYAPDGLSMVGPMPGVKNAFEAHCFTFGIAQGGGAGKVLSEWIINGETQWDMWAVDPRRYTAFADADYCHSKALETYGNEYAMHFPHHEWPAGRDKKLSTLHSRLLKNGAQMGAYNGWERANWFAKTGDDTSQESTKTWSRNGPWEQRVKQECEAVRDHCGMIPITGFSRFTAKGPQARQWVDHLTASRLPKPGRVGLAYFADTNGRVLTEMSLIIHDDHEVSFITAAMAQWHDFELLKNNAPENIKITDHSDETECLLLTGPKAREILTPLTTGHDLSAPWLSVSFEGHVANEPCTLMRVSYAGELGWEIHAAPESMPTIWDRLIEAGVIPFGMFALNSLRLEKSYRSWKGDLSSEYTLLESGLSRFIQWDKPEFKGKTALEAERKNGSQRSFIALVLDECEHDIPPMSPIWHNNAVVGEVTSSGFGYRVNKVIALGVVRSQTALPNTELEIEVFGQKYKAIVQEDRPIWDRENKRIKA